MIDFGKEKGKINVSVNISSKNKNDKVQIKSVDENVFFAFNGVFVIFCR